MKPYDGGQWIGVSRIRDARSCTAPTTPRASG